MEQQTSELTHEQKRIAAIVAFVIACMAAMSKPIVKEPWWIKVLAVSIFPLCIAVVLLVGAYLHLSYDNPWWLLACVAIGFFGKLIYDRI